MTPTVATKILNEWRFIHSSKFFPVLFFPGLITSNFGVTMSRLRLVTFDIMNTILKTKRSIGQEYLDIFSTRFGMQFESARVDQEFPKVFKSMWEIHPNFGAAAGISAREWWATVVRATVENAGVDMKDARYSTTFLKPRTSYSMSVRF